MLRKHILEEEESPSVDVSVMSLHIMFVCHVRQLMFFHSLYYVILFNFDYFRYLLDIKINVHTFKTY